MKKIIVLIWVLAIAGIANCITAQNTNNYSGKVSYNGKEYSYETSCAGVKPMSTTTIETYGLTIYLTKKEQKKVVLKTHCTALEVRRNDSSIKENLDKITFTTVASGKLSPDVKGTSKKLTLEFHLDNFTLIPLYNRDARMGCASFDEGIRNVVYFILKEIK
ncbi:MAG: hypothetical protein EHM93_09910 [Bacteroidales bacterium]|nr:MAG: hypothetical protein EHM93_09910 [Bacteroidales bacterium]